jgi:putative inorganic carbon (HCO3(-)) transporter
MPCGVVAAWYTVRTKHGIGISLACFTLVGLFFASGYTTLNRTIWLGYAIQFVLLGALLLARGEVGVRPSIKARITAYSLAAVAIAGCGAVILSIQSERMAIGGAKDFEEDTRIALWPEIAERIAERPLLGHGFGRGILRESLQAELKTVDTHLWHAHNLFLEAWVQLGAPGFVLLLVVLASLVRRGWSYARDPDERTAACGMALLAVVAGMLVRNMTDSLLVRQNALLFWGVVGVLFALAAKSSPARI